MPRYDYKCTQCETVYEIEHSFDSTEQYFCKEDSQMLAKLFSPTPAHFKGSGWGGQ